MPPWTPVDLTGRHFPVHWGLRANLAHLAEQHPRNVQVPGSSPGVGFLFGVVPRCGPVGESWKRWGGRERRAVLFLRVFPHFGWGVFPLKNWANGWYRAKSCPGAGDVPRVFARSGEVFPSGARGRGALREGVAV